VYASRVILYAYIIAVYAYTTIVHAYTTATDALPEIVYQYKMTGNACLMVINNSLSMN